MAYELFQRSRWFLSALLALVVSLPGFASESESPAQSVSVERARWRWERVAFGAGKDYRAIATAGELLALGDDRVVAVIRQRKAGSDPLSSPSSSLSSPQPAHSSSPTSLAPPPLPPVSPVLSLASPPLSLASPPLSLASPDWTVRRGEVNDLLFRDSGSLLIATSSGLHELSEHGAIKELPLAPGSQAKQVARLARRDGFGAAATEAGVFVSASRGDWVPLAGVLGSRPATALAWTGGRQPGSQRLWALSQGELWWVEFSGDLSQFEVERKREPIRALGVEARSRGLFVDLLFVGERLVALDRAGVSVSRPLSEDWSWEPLSLPPGAEVQRIYGEPGHYWLATNRGLLWAEQLEGPWSRVSAAVGFEAVRDLAIRHPILQGTAQGILQGTVQGILQGTAQGMLQGTVQAMQDREIWVATDAGLWRASQIDRVAGASVQNGVAPFVSPDPSFAQVRTAALRYLDLGQNQLNKMRTRVARRGLFPVFGVHASTGRRSSFSEDLDEAYVSGATRRLFDWEEDNQRDWDVGASLTWDLGDAVYHPEMIDVSRERRELLEFRDEILDELAQLYFERQRILLELASQRGPETSEQIRLRLRASELAAGIDAWTGGAFSRARNEVPFSTHPTTQRNGKR